MKKLLALLVIAAFAVVSDANAWGCRKSCAPAPACPVEVREQPKPDCYVTETIERPVCPQKYVDITYACPDGSNYRNGTVTKSVAVSGKRTRRASADY